MANTIAEGAEAHELRRQAPVQPDALRALSDLIADIHDTHVPTSEAKPLPAAQRHSISTRAHLRDAAVDALTATRPDRRENATIVIDKDTARTWAKQDAAEVARLRSAKRKAIAMTAIAGNMRASLQYAEALQHVSPALASDAQALSAELQKHALASDAAAAESRRLQAIEAHRVARHASIDATALASVARLRRQQIAAVSARLRQDPDPRLHGDDIRDAQQAINVSGHHAHSSRPTAGPESMAATTEAYRVIKRPILESELPQEIRARFLVSAQKRVMFGPATTNFLQRAGQRQGELVFSDAGRQLITSAEDRDTIRAMLDVAKAKHWSEITVSGTDTFRRRAWLEAQMAGMTVRGYAAQPADQEVLRHRRHQMPVTNRVIEDGLDYAKNTGNSDAAAPQRGVHVNADELTTSEQAGLQQARDLLQQKGLSTDFSAAALAQVEKIARGERHYVGTLLDHGIAQYRFDRNNDSSYYITLQTQAGNQTIWGKGLQQAVADSGAQRGDAIVLRNAGQREVTVKEKLLDATGAVTGFRDKSARLNEWAVQPLGRSPDHARAPTVTADRVHAPSTAGDRDLNDHHR